MKRLLFLLLLATLGLAPAQAATRYVGGCGAPSDATIAAAVAAASAGDTINICPGTYDEYVNVDKAGLTIKGSTGKAADVTVRRSGDWATPFGLNAANITLKDMTLVATNGGVGAAGSSPGPMAFENLVVSADKYGLFLYGNGAGAVTFKNVAVTATTDWAIYMGGLTGAHTLEGVTIIGNTAGIYAPNGLAKLTNVNAEGKSGSAISMGNLHAATFTDVTAISSGGYAQGIHIGASHATNHPYTFTTVTASGKNRGINIDRSGKVTMTNVTATGTGESGIYLNTNADGAHEFDNVTATGNGGITLHRGAASFKNVTATGTSGSAIWMGNKYAASFDTVTASAPNHWGIQIANSDGISNLYSFTNVKVTAKGRGIDIARSGKVTMNGITVNTPDYGIWFEDGADGAHELSNLDITAGKGGVSAYGLGLAKVEDFKITATSDAGIGIGTKYDATIRRGVISAPGLMGIYINGSPKNKVTIQDVTLTTGWDYGIMLMKSSEALIQRVCVSGMTATGIYTDWNASNVTLRDSQFGNSGSGVWIFSDPDKKAIVTNNAFLKASPARASSNSSKHRFNQNYWQGVAGGAKYKDGNVEDTNTLGSNPVAGCYSAALSSATLSAHYKFDDTWGSGDSLEDSSGNNKHATLHDIGNRTIAQEASPASGLKPDTCKAGNINKAGNFLTPSTLDIDTASGGKNSVSFWMYWDGGFDAYKFTSLFTWNAANYALMLSKYRAEMGNGVIGFATGNNIDVYGVSANGLANGWHHVAAVFNNGDITQSKLYIDGVQKTLASYGTPGTRSAVTTGIIGGAGGWGDFDWSGKLDNFKIYKGAISSTQIAADMAETATCPGGESGPAALNAVDVGANAVSGQITTKTAGTAFSLDLYALNAARTAQDTAATGAVLVDLLANAATGVALGANNCPAGGTVLGVGTVTLVAGKTTAAVGAVANAWRDVRVRMRYPATGTATVTACSADNFAVKPASLVAVASHADWQTAGTTATLANTGAGGGAIHKAGRPFTVRVTGYNAGNAVTGNYDGSPTAGIACVLPASGCVAGSFNAGAFSAGSGSVSSDTASYDEVGAISATFSDSGYAAVDRDDTAASCAGYHVCANAINIGRFVPDHFDVSSNTPAFLPACGGFTYLGQPFGFGTPPLWTVTARNGAGTTTRNYTGSLFKIAAATVSAQTWSAAGSTVAAVASLPAVGVTDLGGGQGSLAFGVGDPAAGGGLAFARTAPVAPFDASLTLAAGVADSEGVIHAGNPYQHSGIGFDDGNAGTTNDAQMRFGRLRLANAVGSELLPLPVPLAAQFWNGLGYVGNSADNCTTISAPTLTFFSQTADNQLAGGETTASFNATLVAGNGNLRFSAPGAGNFGFMDLSVAAPAWLRFNWDGVDQNNDGNLLDDNPRARATFGKRRGSDKVIIRREIY